MTDYVKDSLRDNAGTEADLQLFYCQKCGVNTPFYEHVDWAREFTERYCKNCESTVYRQDFPGVGLG